MKQFWKRAAVAIVSLALLAGMPRGRSRFG